MFCFKCFPKRAIRYFWVSHRIFWCVVYFCNGRPTGSFIIYCLINVDSLGYKRGKFWRISLGFLSLSRVLQSLNTKLESNRPRYKRKEKNHDIYSWFWVSLHDQRVKPFFARTKLMHDFFKANTTRAFHSLQSALRQNFRSRAPRKVFIWRICFSSKFWIHWTDG